MIILINHSKTSVGTQRAKKKITNALMWKKWKKNSIKEINNAFIYVFIEKKKKYVKLGKLVFETI